MRLVCKQVVGATPSMHGGSTKRQQPQRPAPT
jgi:hypothetical protein